MRAKEIEQIAIVEKSYREGILLRLLRWVLRPLLSRLSVDREWVEQLRAATVRGTVVHVVLHFRLLEVLCLDQCLRGRGLPPLRTVAGVGWSPRWPIRWLLRALWGTCRRCDAAEVTAFAARGESSLVVLRSARRAGRLPTGPEEEVTEALLSLQRRSARPLLMVPQSVFWGRRRQGRSRGVLGFLQQLWEEGPGLFRSVVRLFFARRHDQIRVAQPLDLQEFLAAHQAGPEEELARQARFLLLRRIEQERKVVLGPMAKSAEALRDEVLRGAGLTDEIAELAQRNHVPLQKLQKRARRVLREIQAVPKSRYIAALNALLWWAWRRLFEGVEVDQEGLARWREVAHEGPLVIVSSHKSHVDYLILSQLFWEDGIFPPHIAAGRNLSFWPLGAIFRGCGAFFIRRHFMDDELYVAVLKAYVRKILQEGYHLEFFIEGTRSRSGKMLPPRVGLLGMVVEAAQRLKGYKVHLAPVSITYGRVPEEGAHAAEAEGAEKREEDIKGLIRTRKALKKQHGRLYVQFGRPLDLTQYLQERGLEEHSATSEVQQDLVREIAYRTVHEINRVSLVTPTALVSTALLLHRRRGMSHQDLRLQVRRLAHWLHELDARFSASLRAASGASGVPERVLLEAVRFLADAGLVKIHDRQEEAIYTVPAEGRLALDYYKNSILHPLVNGAVVAAALEPLVDQGRPWDELAQRARFLCQLLKYEFVFRADGWFELDLEQTFKQLENLGVLVVREGQIVASAATSGRFVHILATLLENFIESYHILLYQLRELGQQPVAERELVKLALSKAERLYLIGEVELQESRSKVNFQNAIRAFRDLGVLERREDGLLAVTDTYRDAVQLARLDRELASYVSK